MMPLGCGACNLCCKLLAVPDINKPARMLCWWTGVHGGCQRQSEKASDPALLACAQFKCLWLASQTHENEEYHQPRAMRPDITHVVIGPYDREDDTLIYVQVDPEHPSAWKKEPVASYLRGIMDRGGKCELVIGERHVRLEAGGDIG